MFLYLYSHQFSWHLLHKREKCYYFTQIFQWYLPKVKRGFRILFTYMAFKIQIIMFITFFRNFWPNGVLSFLLIVPILTYYELLKLKTLFCFQQLFACFRCTQIHWTNERNGSWGVYENNGCCMEQNDKTCPLNGNKFIDNIICTLLILYQNENSSFNIEFHQCLKTHMTNIQYLRTVPINSKV